MSELSNIFLIDIEFTVFSKSRDLVSSTSETIEKGVKYVQN